MEVTKVNWFVTCSCIAVHVRWVFSSIVSRRILGIVLASYVCSLFVPISDQGICSTCLKVEDPVSLRRRLVRDNKYGGGARIGWV